MNELYWNESKTRDNLNKIYLESNLNRDWIEYKNYRNDYYLNKLNIKKDVTNKQTDDDKDYVTKNGQNFDHHNNDNNTKNKTMWNLVKDLIDKLKQ